MATVRITDTLKSEVDYVIRSQFNTRRAPLESRLENVLAPTTELTDAIHGTVTEMLDTKRADLEKVPAWLNYMSVARIASLNDIPIPYRKQNIRFSKAIPWPVQASGIDLSKLKSSRLARWATDLKAVTDQLDTLAVEEEAFRNQVRKLLDSCSTYKQAVEIWPQLTSVTPQHILNRHNAPTERAKREEVKVDLDTDALNMTAVVNTIATSQKKDD